MLHLIRTAWAEPSLCRTITQATRPSKPDLLGGNPAASAITPPDECCIRRHSARFVGVELLARDVLDRAVGVLGLGLAQHDRHLGEVEAARGGDAVKAGDELEAVVGGAHEDRDEQSLERDRSGERAHVLWVEFADVVGHSDLFEWHAAAGLVGADGHQWSSWTRWPAPLAGRSQPNRAPARACNHGRGRTAGGAHPARAFPSGVLGRVRRPPRSFAAAAPGGRRRAAVAVGRAARAGKRPTRAR